MNKVINSNGIDIGTFDGISVRSKNGEVIFRVIDGEVFQPFEYTEENLQNMNKGQMLGVGSFSGNKAVSNEGELLFSIS